MSPLINDEGVTSSMQYDRWIASIKAKQARKSHARRAAEHADEAVTEEISRAVSRITEGEPR